LKDEPVLITGVPMEKVTLRFCEMTETAEEERRSSE
jgi:hypothetical protein